MIDYLFSRFNSFSLETNGLTPENLSSRSKRNFSYFPNSETLIIGIPAWGENLSKWKYIKKWVEKSGSSFLYYEFPREILSDNHILTEKIFHLINTTIREDIKELKKKHNFKRCVMVGISLGSSYGSMIYKGN